MDRALPDVRDGLKPSQRRILVAMNDLNLGPRSQAPQVRQDRRRHQRQLPPARRSRHLPHAGAAWRQDWNMRYPLIDPQGNFGSTDGDPPAAMRYTEARMAAAAMEMLADLELDTVDFQPNYDERLDGADRPAQQVPQPAGQRLDRHRRRHGVQPAAAQPARDLRRDRQGDRQPRGHARRAAGDRPRPRLPHRRHHLRPRRDRRGYKTGRGRITLRAQDARRGSRRAASRSSYRRDPLRRHPQVDRRVDRRVR